MRFRLRQVAFVFFSIIAAKASSKCLDLAWEPTEVPRPGKRAEQLQWWQKLTGTWIYQGVGFRDD